MPSKKFGLWEKIEGGLPEKFSIMQFMSIMSMEESEHRDARNILKQFFLARKIRRLGSSMYEKV